MRVDAHQHFWKYNPSRHAWITEDMSVIRRDFLPVDLSPILKSHNIGGCIAVQADQSEAETEFLLNLASENDFILGVVGWVDLKSPLLANRLSYYRQFKKLKGFRHIVQAEPEGFLLDPQFIAGVKKLGDFGFTYDLLIYPHQLEEALAFIHRVGDIPIVIDHMAKPSIRTGEISGWERSMAALASFENVFCKISGMVTEAKWGKWKNEEFIPYVKSVTEMFGWSRVMYGSDWPVCILSASYDEQLSIVEGYIKDKSESVQESVMGSNALRFYKIQS